MRYDVVVVGLGAMGSAATYQLAKSGASVLGIDRYLPPHALGSTHGDSRITRLAIGEGAEYVPLVHRSHEIWRDIEAQTGTEILDQCGGLVMASATTQPMHDSEAFLDQTIATARAFDITHQLLDADEVRRRFPHFSLRGDELAYYEPSAGFVRPERAVEAQLQLARSFGATVALGERVLQIDDHSSHVSIRTTAETVEAGTAVVTAGAWLPELVPDVASSLRVHRQVMFWFDLADPSAYLDHRDSPVFIWWHGPAHTDMFYGFPMVDGPAGGAKVASEQYDEVTTPDDVDRQVTDAEIQAMAERHVRDRFPGLGGTCVKTRACLYTVAPGSRFVIARHPAMPGVIVASPCSGHGFKHSAAIGECLSQLALKGESTLDISAFGFPT